MPSQESSSPQFFNLKTFRGWVEMVGAIAAAAASIAAVYSAIHSHSDDKNRAGIIANPCNNVQGGIHVEGSNNTSCNNIINDGYTVEKHRTYLEELVNKKQSELNVMPINAPDRYRSEGELRFLEPD
jgi:hypothetical protein